MRKNKTKHSQHLTSHDFGPQICNPMTDCFTRGAGARILLLRIRGVRVGDLDVSQGVRCRCDTTQVSSGGVTALSDLMEMFILAYRFYGCVVYIGY